MIKYEIKESVDIKQLINLRKTVGWDSIENSCEKALNNSYLYICCYDDNNNLIGFLDVVSNAVTDAYIQDVIVHPDYQGISIGTKMMNIAINRLKEDGIQFISVLFEETLLSFYKKFGFHIMMSGQIYNDKKA